jgi:hypothetical protein
MSNRKIPAKLAETHGSSERSWYIADLDWVENGPTLGDTELAAIETLTSFLEWLKKQDIAKESYNGAVGNVQAYCFYKFGVGIE